MYSGIKLEMSLFMFVTLYYFFTTDASKIITKKQNKNEVYDSI